MSNKLDGYSLRARVAPVFLSILPIFISINLWAPQSHVFEFGTGSLLSSLALSLLSACFGRDLGKKRESKLWQSWGGPPTTRFLRHSDTQFNPVRRTRCHKNLQVKIPDIKIPSLKQETNNPIHADQVYEACTKYLINKTRDQKVSPLIYRENLYYGFLRNLWGLKPLGLSLSSLGLAASLLYGRIEYLQTKTMFGKSFIPVFICLIALLIWIFWVRPKTIKVIAEAYAERLLEYCEQME